MAVPSFTNITLVDPLNAGFMSPITAFGATGSVPSTTSTSTEGIDEDVRCCRLQNSGTSLTAGDIVGAHGSLPASYDISGANQALYLHMHNRDGFSRLSADPDTVRLILTSGGGTTEYAAWEMGGRGSAGYPTAAAKWKIISLARSPDEQTAGFDPTDITGLGATLKIGSTGTTSFELYLDQLLYIDGAVTLQGGEVANPASYEEFYSLMGPTSGNASHSMLLEKSGFAYTTHASLDNQCNYWRETLFTDGLYSLAFAEEDGAEKPYPATGFFTNKVLCPASADIELNNGLVASGVRVAIDWDLTAATSAKMNSTINASLSSGAIDGGNLDGQTLIGNTSPIEIGTAPTGAWSVKNSSAGGIRITGAAGDYSGLEINFDSITGNAIALGDGGAGTYNLGGISATSSINIHNNSATNAITVQLDPSVTATSSTAGGSITIDNAVTVDVTVTVKDQATGLPIENAVVYLEAAAGGSLAAGTVILNATTGPTGIATTSLVSSGVQPIFGRVRKSSATPFYTNYPLSGDITANGFATTALMVRED